MVSHPRNLQAFCKYCKKHTQHKKYHYKPGKESKQSRGIRKKLIKQKGFGGSKFSKLYRIAKTTKKIVFKIECSQCKKKSQNVVPRARLISCCCARMRRVPPIKTPSRPFVRFLYKKDEI
jgi:large subunit ribosomal protein L44e